MTLQNSFVIFLWKRRKKINGFTSHSKRGKGKDSLAARCFSTFCWAAVCMSGGGAGQDEYDTRECFKEAADSSRLVLPGTLVAFSLPSLHHPLKTIGIFQRPARDAAADASRYTTLRGVGTLKKNDATRKGDSCCQLAPPLPGTCPSRALSPRFYFIFFFNFTGRPLIYAAVLVRMRVSERRRMRSAGAVFRLIKSRMNHRLLNCVSSCQLLI